MNKWTLALSILLLVALAYAAKPVYEFYAHRHTLPMLGKHYLVIPEKAPQQSQLHAVAYAQVSEVALAKLEQHRQSINSPGISAAVAIDGTLIWAGASGWADLQEDQAMNTTSQFRIGSTSKALNSALLARMVDAGSITLDTPLSAYDLAALNSSWADITPRQLASHMAGIPHYGDNTDWGGLYRTATLNTHYDDVADSLAVFDDSDTLFAPGDRFEYSSLGTVLLSAVMQEASGVRYQRAMQEQVLNPLHMTHTMPEPAIGQRSVQSPDLATFYWHPEAGQDTVAPWREVDLSHRLAGGGFISTSSDLVKLGIGFNTANFISRPTREAFWTPQRLNSGEANEQGYAIGWRAHESDFGEGIGTLFYANHGGVSRGAQSWLMVIPKYDMAVAININANTEEFWTFGEVSFELVKIFLRQRQNIVETGRQAEASQVDRPAT